MSLAKFERTIQHEQIRARSQRRMRLARLESEQRRQGEILATRVKQDARVVHLELRRLEVMKSKEPDRVAHAQVRLTNEQKHFLFYLLTLGRFAGPSKQLQAKAYQVAASLYAKDLYLKRAKVEFSGNVSVSHLTRFTDFEREAKKALSKRVEELRKELVAPNIKNSVNPQLWSELDMALQDVSEQLIVIESVVEELRFQDFSLLHVAGLLLSFVGAVYSMVKIAITVLSSTVAPPLAILLGADFILQSLILTNSVLAMDAYEEEGDECYGFQNWLPEKLAKGLSFAEFARGVYDLKSAYKSHKAFMANPKARPTLFSGARVTFANYDELLGNSYKAIGSLNSSLAKVALTYGSVSAVDRWRDDPQSFWSVYGVLKAAALNLITYGKPAFVDQSIGRAPDHIEESAFLVQQTLRVFDLMESRQSHLGRG